MTEVLLQRIQQLERLVLVQAGERNQDRMVQGASASQSAGDDSVDLHSDGGSRAPPTYNA
jgi:hypothetical protein